MNKKRLSISTFGAILGIAGIEHGIGEILQGKRKPEGAFFQSWPDNNLYNILAGEPAFTVLTNLPLFITGVIAVIISLLLITWAAFYIESKYGGPILLGLTFCQFLFGAGIAGPLLIGIIISLTATKINSASNWWKNHHTLRNTFIPVWKYAYPISIVSWFSMWPGLVIFGMFIPLTHEQGSIVVTLSGISFLSFIITLISAFAIESPT